MMPEDILALGLPDDECWEYPTVNRDGYGYFYRNRKQFLMHREMYRLYHGSIPEGMHVDHVCHTRSCCNPHHLDAVSHLENQRRKRRGTQSHDGSL